MRTELSFKRSTAASTVSGSTSSASKSPDAKSGVKHDVIVLLKNDHAAVKKLFTQYEKLAKQQDIDGKVHIANKICAELVVHTMAEEEVFYPAALEATHDPDMFNEAKVEHDSAKDLIAQIQNLDPEDPMFDANVKVLGEYITHHVEEEETEMFPMVRASRMVNLKQMATEFTARRAQLMQRLHDSDGELDPQQLWNMMGLAAQH